MSNERLFELSTVLLVATLLWGRIRSVTSLTPYGIFYVLGLFWTQLLFIHHVERNLTRLFYPRARTPKG